MASREEGEGWPHDGVRHDQGGISGAPRGVGEPLEDGGAPGSPRLGRPDTGMQADRCGGSAIPGRRTSVRGPSCRAAGLAPGPGGGPHPPDDGPRGTTGRTAGRAWWRGLALARLALAALSVLQRQAEGGGREGTAGMAQAAMPDLPAALGSDVLAAPAETLQGVEVGGAEAGPAPGAGGEGDRAARE